VKAATAQQDVANQGSIESGFCVLCRFGAPYLIGVVFVNAVQFSNLPALSSC
jgi:hypothetical protein